MFKVFIIYRVIQIMSRHWMYNADRRSQDLQGMKERDNLHPEKTDDGRHYLSLASYTLSKEERDIMFEYLSSIKVPSRFSSNIKGI